MYIARLSLGHMDMMGNHIRDDYDLHQLVYRLFPYSAERDFLYYADHSKGFGNISIVIQSEGLPQDCGIGRLEIREIPDDFLNQDCYWFRVRINPVVKSDGRIIRIEGRTDEAVAWLCRRENALGVHFDEKTLDKESGGIIRMQKCRDEHPIVISYADITGILNVTDRDKFHSSIRNGIGGHKGFGFGMFQLRPVKEDRR